MNLAKLVDYDQQNTDCTLPGLLAGGAAVHPATVDQHGFHVRGHPGLVGMNLCQDQIHGGGADFPVVLINSGKPRLFVVQTQMNESNFPGHIQTFGAHPLQTEGVIADDDLRALGLHPAKKVTAVLFPVLFRPAPGTELSVELAEMHRNLIGGRLQHGPACKRAQPVGTDPVHLFAESEKSHPAVSQSVRLSQGQIHILKIGGRGPVQAGGFEGVIDRGHRQRKGLQPRKHTSFFHRKNHQSLNPPRLQNPKQPVELPPGSVEFKVIHLVAVRPCLRLHPLRVQTDI